ncbi:Ig-like domain-containing protein [Actinacidiphila glaucinigra]|uniref:Ig-like domain-containing protein n=1 Tax=Actinacidiphila glaucinigra TaxID=235986 RepID=UPI0037B3C231
MTAVVGAASPAAADQSTTTLQISPTTAAAGSPVQLTARVFCPGEPGGGVGLGVTFFDGGNILDTRPVVANGFAGYVARFATTGTHTITAAYNGNVNCFASNAKATVTVTPPSTAPTAPTRAGTARAAGRGRRNA